MPPLPKAKALKRDDNVGLDLKLQLGGQAGLAGRWEGWGSRPSLPIYCRC